MSVSLTFMGNTEEAFEFYRSVFGGELGSILRMGDVPPGPDQPSLAEAERDKVMHVELTILPGRTRAPAWRVDPERSATISVTAPVGVGSGTW